mmetsp:Transcript_18023/g.45081  ORF Transcript_18023/g.45081 Transcript_18023/m.45081 type:complete len:223 (-) Transcript_18023:1606-2274(-)
MSRVLFCGEFLVELVIHHLSAPARGTRGPLRRSSSTAVERLEGITSSHECSGHVAERDAEVQVTALREGTLERGEGEERRLTVVHEPLRRRRWIGHHCAVLFCKVIGKYVQNRFRNLRPRFSSFQSCHHLLVTCRFFVFVCWCLHHTAVDTNGRSCSCTSIRRLLQPVSVGFYRHLVQLRAHVCYHRVIDVLYRRRPRLSPVLFQPQGGSRSPTAGHARAAC